MPVPTGKVGLCPSKVFVFKCFTALVTHTIHDFNDDYAIMLLNDLQLYLVRLWILNITFS